jgi:hypothetical protein
MIRYLLAAATVIAFLAASLPSGAAPSRTAPSEAAALEIPPEIRFPSSVGDVLFHHQMHMKDLAVKCADCHHQINAKQLHTPHPDYFGSSWINCRTCHKESERIGQKAYRCSECHQTGPKNIADETLSAKVVVHRQCWKCHAVGTGKDASTGCEKCHSGKKKS